uniref:Uncharacterized protein n=1 Tax=Panagrolaimus davidi TaxID=227884 RepID=A0A914QTY7_9BILA
MSDNNEEVMSFDESQPLGDLTEDAESSVLHDVASIDTTMATLSSTEPPATPRKVEKFTPARKIEIKKLIDEKKCELKECKTTSVLLRAGARQRRAAWRMARLSKISGAWRGAI